MYTTGSDAAFSALDRNYRHHCSAVTAFSPYVNIDDNSAPFMHQ